MQIVPRHETRLAESSYNRVAGLTNKEFNRRFKNSGITRCSQPLAIFDPRIIIPEDDITLDETAPKYSNFTGWND
jgi:hypothetical protein